MKQLLYIFFAGIFITLNSCEEVIKVQLADAEPAIIFEGSITNEPGPYEFRITKSVDYFEGGDPIPVENATFTIRDDTGNTDQLIEVAPGIYHTQQLLGTVGRTYSFEIEVEGKTYKAQDKLPRPASIDGIFTIYQDEPGLILDTGYYVTLLATDPSGLGDHYSFRFTSNGETEDDYFFSNDDLIDGQQTIVQFPYTLEIGDSVEVELHAISEPLYDFYIKLFTELNTSSGSPFGAPPTNLNGNIDNNALGYLGAISITRRSIVVAP